MAIDPQKTFNASEHITKLPRWVKDEHGNSQKIEDDYLEVKWRLVWFRATYPQGTIETQEMCIDLDREISVEKSRWDKNLKKRVVYETVAAKGYARIKAIVQTGEGGIGTGTKTETAVDFPDFIEKAETGAIGRALAALGFGTQFTGGEMEEGKRIVDSPVANGESQPTPNSKETAPQPRQLHAPDDPSIKAANDGLRKAASAAKQRALSNGLDWEKLLSECGITSFDSGKDIGSVNRIIDSLIEANKQAS